MTVLTWQVRRQAQRGWGTSCEASRGNSNPVCLLLPPNKMQSTTPTPQGAYWWCWEHRWLPGWLWGQLSGGSGRRCPEGSWVFVDRGWDWKVEEQFCSKRTLRSLDKLHMEETHSLVDYSKGRVLALSGSLP